MGGTSNVALGRNGSFRSVTKKFQLEDKSDRISVSVLTWNAAGGWFSGFPGQVKDVLIVCSICSHLSRGNEQFPLQMHKDTARPGYLWTPACAKWGEFILLRAEIKSHEFLFTLGAGKFRLMTSRSFYIRRSKLCLHWLQWSWFGCFAGAVEMAKKKILGGYLCECRMYQFP